MFFTIVKLRVRRNWTNCLIYFPPSAVTLHLYYLLAPLERGFYWHYSWQLDLINCLRFRHRRRRLQSCGCLPPRPLTNITWTENTSNQLARRIKNTFYGFLNSPRFSLFTWLENLSERRKVNMKNNSRRRRSERIWKLIFDVSMLLEMRKGRCNVRVFFHVLRYTLSYCFRGGSENDWASFYKPHRITKMLTLVHANRNKSAEIELERKTLS